MNRMVVLGVVAFFAIVSIAMMSVDNKALAGRGCRGCDCAADCGGCGGNDCCGRRRHRRRRNRCCGQQDCCPAPCEPACCEPAPCCGTAVEEVHEAIEGDEAAPPAPEPAGDEASAYHAPVIYYTSF